MVLQGVINGNSIQLEEPSGLPNGQQVSVVVTPVDAAREALLRCVGAWAEDGDQLDAFVEETYRLRRLERPELGP